MHFKTLLAGALLALSAVPAFAEVSVGLGMDLSDEPDYFDAKRQPNRLDVLWQVAPDVSAGLELGYRKPKGEGNDSSLSNAGIKLVYGKALGPGQLYTGLGAGYMRLDSNIPAHGTYIEFKDRSEGYYLAPLLGYRLQLAEHFSAELEYRHLFERLSDPNQALPPGASTSANATGLQNIVYNPYAGLEVRRSSNGHQDIDLTSINLRWQF